MYPYPQRVLVRWRSLYPLFYVKISNQLFRISNRLVVDLPDTF